MGTRSKEYTIEFNKLQMGLNEYQFTLNDKFLEEFDYSPVTRANVEVELTLMKAENLYDLKFDFKGTVGVVCDTCAEDIDIPIHESYSMIMKLSEESNFEDSELVYIARTEIEFDLKQYLYESLLLSVPQRKNCEKIPDPKPCNQEVLNKLAGAEKKSEDEGESGDKEDPRWNKLKDLLN